MNFARKYAAETFREVLYQALETDKPVSENQFALEWCKRLSNSSVSLGQWYCPPPTGVSILFATPNQPGRINFCSLRSPEYWSSDKVFLDKGDGFIFAYCSPVSRDSSEIGDFSITLYLGACNDTISTFRTAYKATNEVIEEVKNCSLASELFAHSNKIFAGYNMANTITSVTDPCTSDLGHSIPSLSLKTDDLTEEQKQELSSKRMFINRDADWSLSNSTGFTIEPQLVSLADPLGPKFTFHYFVRKNQSLEVQDDTSGLLRELGLIL